MFWICKKSALSLSLYIFDLAVVCGFAGPSAGDANQAASSSFERRVSFGMAPFVALWATSFGAGAGRALPGGAGRAFSGGTGRASTGAAREGGAGAGAAAGAAA